MFLFQKIIDLKYEPIQTFEDHTSWEEFRFGVFWLQGSFHYNHLISDIFGENFDIRYYYYGQLHMTEKSQSFVRFSSFTHKSSPEEGDTLHWGRGPGSYLVSLPSFMHSFHFQAQHGYSLQQDGERAGWRAYFLPSRTPPRSLLRHFRLHPIDQDLDTRQHLAIMEVRQYQLHL